MPAAQGEVANRHVRFTLRFRRTITIAAMVGVIIVRHRAGRNTARNDGFQQVIGRRAASAAIREFTASRNPKSRAMTPLEQRRNRNSRRLRTINVNGEDFSATRLMRGLSERSGKGGRSGKKTFREKDVPKNEGVPGNEGVGEHVRTRFHAGLWAR